MTENSTSDIVRMTIDAYLDSVEEALLAANAPRGDRVQVLADLESQIADMLAQQPAPLTEEIVKSVIEKLEPASHFAAMYGNCQQPRTDQSREVVDPVLDKIRWSRVAIACFVLPLFGTSLEFAFHFLYHVGNGAVLVLSIVAGLIATPFALAMAYWQVRARPGRFPDRNLVVNMIVGFAAVAPAFAMIVLTEWTYGLVLIPFGFVAVVYLQYTFVRRVCRHMVNALPPQSGNGSSSDAREREMGRPIGSVTTVPAV
jgi:hypothetical protein